MCLFEELGTTVEEISMNKDIHLVLKESNQIQPPIAIYNRVLK
jgi:hypothetical protein